MDDGRQRWVVDSVEDGIAAVNDGGGRILHLPASILPSGTRGGDVLSVTRTADGEGACTLRIAIDRAATDQALRISREQVERRLPHDPGGDIVL